MELEKLIRISETLTEVCDKLLTYLEASTTPNKAPLAEIVHLITATAAFSNALTDEWARLIKLDSTQFEFYNTGTAEN